LSKKKKLLKALLKTPWGREFSDAKKAAIY